MSRDARLHSLTPRDTSTASAELSHEQSHAILVIRKEESTYHQGGTDGVSGEGDEEIDPWGITNRLYARAESSLKGRRTLGASGTIRSQVPAASNRSRHPIEI